MRTALRRLALVAAATLSAGLAGCGSTQNAANAGSADVPYVVFNNQAQTQATVFILAGGLATRVGTVMSGRREPLRISSSILGGTRSIQFGVELLGSNLAPRSGQITISPGDSLEISLTPDGRAVTVLPLRTP